jgi:hypothetical protein
MKKILSIIALSGLAYTGHGQTGNTYADWIKKANAYYDSKQYTLSAEAFTQAFAANGGKGFSPDRYNAACTWALAGNKDSAFFQLERIATKANYTNYNHLTTDTDLESLHSDPRWKTICEAVKQNKDKEEANLDKQLVAMLDSIYTDDQAGRMRHEQIAKQYGNDSKELKELWADINLKDSLNLIKVERVIGKYGWPGPEIAGRQGSQTVFLVVQHADIKTQEKYLPLMREAVKNKKAQPSSLALLEDRVALRQGKKQIYGSQIGGDGKGKMWVSPLEDPDNVDKRRASVGLGPLADYVRNWSLEWDVEKYKKELPEIERKEKQQKQ